MNPENLTNSELERLAYRGMNNVPLAVIGYQCIEVERRYHERFAALRVRGEWFLHEGDLAAHIAGLRGEQ